jgi:hypothetical protein
MSFALFDRLAALTFGLSLLSSHSQTLHCHLRSIFIRFVSVLPRADHSGLAAADTHPSFFCIEDLERTDADRHALHFLSSFIPHFDSALIRVGTGSPADGFNRYTHSVKTP